MKQIQYVIQQGIANEKQCVVDMNMITEEELAIYKEMNGTEVPYPNKSNCGYVLLKPQGNFRIV